MQTGNVRHKGAGGGKKLIILKISGSLISPGDLLAKGYFVAPSKENINILNKAGGQS